MTWEAVIGVVAVSAAIRVVFETLSGARNLTMPWAPLRIVPPMRLVGVVMAMPNVSVWPTRAWAWKFEWVTLTVTDPSAVVEAAVKFESVPFKMYVTFG